MHACTHVYRLGEGCVRSVGVGDIGRRGRLLQVVQLARVRGESRGIEVCPQLPQNTHTRRTRHCSTRPRDSQQNSVSVVGAYAVRSYAEQTAIQPPRSRLNSMKLSA